MNVVFVTGNANKAKYFSELVGLTIENHDADAAEIQSLDLVEIATHKAKEAYAQLGRPVIVEDAGVYISALGQLPGPFIKWFIQEIGLEKICRLVDANEDRSAEARDTFAYYDGNVLKHFTGNLAGKIANEPRGNRGYDWDKIFIPHNEERTLAEMNYDDYKKFHLQIKPIRELRNFLVSIDTNKA